MTDTTPETSTRILQMTVHGFKGVQHVSIAPDGNVVTIAGANGAGKTSFIDAICELLDPKGVKLGPRLIHEGETEARATIRTKTWTAERTWKQQGKASTLIVTSSDGLRHETPATLLKSLVGKISFDPTEFMFLDAEEQRARLLSLVDLPFDLAQLDRDWKLAEQRRKEANAAVKQRTGQLAGLAVPVPGTPEEPVTSREILDNLKAAREHNGEREGLISTMGQTEDRIESLQRQIAELVEVQKERREQLLAMPPLVDTAELEEQLDDVAAVNGKIEAARQYREVRDALEQEKRNAQAAQSDMDDVTEAKRSGLAAAEFPVEGLGFDDAGVTLGGIPFKQVNTAASILASAEIAMKTAGPGVRVMRISHGSLLDSDSVAALERLADANDYLVLREVVDESASPEVAVVFSEGTATGRGVVE